MTVAYQMVTVHPVRIVLELQMVMQNLITAAFVKVAMKPMIVANLKVVPMVNLIVVMALAYLDHGNVMYTGVIVPIALMKPIAVEMMVVVTV